MPTFKWKPSKHKRRSAFHLIYFLGVNNWLLVPSLTSACLLVRNFNTIILPLTKFFIFKSTYKSINSHYHVWLPRTGSVFNYIAIVVQVLHFCIDEISSIRIISLWRSTAGDRFLLGRIRRGGLGLLYHNRPMGLYRFRFKTSFSLHWCFLLSLLPQSTVKWISETLNFQFTNTRRSLSVAFPLNSLTSKIYSYYLKINNY